ncbi:hypothetical protein [Deinococcus kurensis]|uniref:hypothetical protein n=1 Tax=Deinococcus kurensis TaxID=2662757 RepID=UPI0012D2DF51|nr:hypothetical protein [Deinococcus kurensis]
MTVPTPTPVPVLPMFPRPAPVRPAARLVRRRRLSDALLGAAGVLLLVALVSASLLPALAALPLVGLGLRLSTRRVVRRYVEMGRVEWL